MNRILWFTLGSITTLVAGTIITALGEKEEPILVLNTLAGDDLNLAAKEGMTTEVDSETTRPGETPNPIMKTQGM